MADIKKITVGTLVSATLLLISFFVITTSILAFSPGPKRQKTAISIEVKKGDTLWSIAKRYMPEEYSHIDDYIKEIKQSNGIADDMIHEGKHIIIPYFLEEPDS